MTREERLDWLCRLRSGLVWFDVPPKERPVFEQVLSEVIKDLEQEPCEDAVSRQALIERINNAEENFKADNMESIASDDGNPFVDGVLSGVFNIREMVAQAPSVTPTTCIAKVTFDKDELQKIVDEKVKEMVVERKKGKWIEEPNCWLRCSCCKSHYPHTSINGVNGSNYCPNCGAEMESEKW